MNYIDLDRKFWQLETSEGDRHRAPLGWQTILTKHRVVVLGESGSGKTAEFKGQAQALRHRNATSFFLSFRELGRGFMKSLHRDDKAVFDRWAATVAPAWFFLDAADEAANRTQSLGETLRALSEELGQTLLGRAHVLISCRSLDWSVSTDGQTVASALHPFRSIDSGYGHGPLQSEPAPRGADVFVARFAPLDRQRRSRLANSLNIPRMTQFIDDLEQTGLSFLAERPGDFLWLASHWREHGRLNSYEQILDDGIKAGLRSSTRDNDALAITEAMSGAKELAAALSFTQATAIVLPGMEQAMISSGLDSAVVLPDWNDARRGKLLACGLFSATEPGRVQFRDVTVQRYLTAKWVDLKLRAGRAITEVVKIFFPDVYGLETVAPHLEQVAAWLALWHPEFFESIVRREPEILFGPPFASRLSDDQKVRLWSAYVERFSDVDRLFDPLGERDAFIISDPGLLSEIRQSWHEPGGDILRRRILRVVAERRLPQYGDLAQAIALDRSANELTRMEAIRAVGALGDDDTLQVVAEELLAAEPASYFFSAALADSLYPAVFSRSELIRFLWTQQQAKDDAGRYRGLKGDLRFLLDDETVAARFLHDLVEDLSGANHEAAPETLSIILQILEPLAGDLISSLKGAHPVQDIFRLVTRLETGRYRPSRPEGPIGIRDLQYDVAGNRWLNRYLFWKYIGRVRPNANLDAAHGLVKLAGDHLWRLDWRDEEWLCQDFHQRENDGDRRLILSLLVAIYSKDSEILFKAEWLLDFVSDDTVLVAHLLADLRKVLSLRRTATQAEILRKVRKARVDEWSEDPREQWLTLTAAIRNDPERLRGSTKEVEGELYALTSGLAAKLGLDDNLTEAARHWELLRKEIGDDAAYAYRDAALAYWRQDRHDGTVADTGLTLVGFAVERASDPTWAASLNIKHVDRALERLCADVMLYTDFLDDLFAARRGKTLQAINERIEREWTTPHRIHGAAFLRHFARTETTIDLDLLYGFATTLMSHETKDRDCFEFGIGVLQRAARRIPVDILDFAIERFHKFKPTVVERLAASSLDGRDPTVRYLLLAMQANAGVATELLRAWIESVPSELRSELTEYVFGFLFGERDIRQRELADVLSVAEIRELLGLFLDYYEPGDRSHDRAYVARPGDVPMSAYNRARRATHAMSVGGNVLIALFLIGSREAQETLQTLESETRLILTTRRPVQLAKAMIARKSTGEAWSVARFRQFSDGSPLVPTNGEELFEAILSLCDEIAYEFSFEDSSLQPLLAAIPRNETAIQKWLHWQLKKAAKGRFTVHREVEVALGNKPDVIAAIPTAEVAIEVKQAESWSSQQLVTALQKQLSEDYLLPKSRRHGILAITLHAECTWKHPVTGKPIGFEELIGYLSTLAEQIRSNASGEIFVAVRSFDASTPDKKKRHRARR